MNILSLTCSQNSRPSRDRIHVRPLGWTLFGNFIYQFNPIFPNINLSIYDYFFSFQLIYMNRGTTCRAYRWTVQFCSIGWCDDEGWIKYIFFTRPFEYIYTHAYQHTLLLRTSGEESFFIFLSIRFYSTRLRDKLRAYSFH